MEKENSEQRRKLLGDYLGLESEGDLELYEILETELGAMGAWGNKILTYLNSVLSRNKRYKDYVQKEDMDLYKKLLSDSLNLLKIELKNNDNL